jgi:hypothetical protein
MAYESDRAVRGVQSCRRVLGVASQIYFRGPPNFSRCEPPLPRTAHFDRGGRRSMFKGEFGYRTVDAFAREYHEKLLPRVHSGDGHQLNITETKPSIMVCKVYCFIILQAYCNPTQTTPNMPAIVDCGSLGT